MKLLAASNKFAGPSSFLKKIGCLGAESGGGGTDWPRPAGGDLMEEMNEEKLGSVGEEGTGLPRPCPCPSPIPGGGESILDSGSSGSALPGEAKSNLGEPEPRPRPRPPPPPVGEEEEVEKGIRDCLVALEKPMGLGRESVLPMLPLIWKEQWHKTVSSCFYNAPQFLRDQLSNKWRTVP